MLSRAMGRDAREDPLVLLGDDERLRNGWGRGYGCYWRHGQLLLGHPGRIGRVRIAVLALALAGRDTATAAGRDLGQREAAESEQSGDNEQVLHLSSSVKRNGRTISD